MENSGGGVTSFGAPGVGLEKEGGGGTGAAAIGSAAACDCAAERSKADGTCASSSR